MSTAESATTPLGATNARSSRCVINYKEMAGRVSAYWLVKCFIYNFHAYTYTSCSSSNIFSTMLHVAVEQAAGPIS